MHAHGGAEGDTEVVGLGRQKIARRMRPNHQDVGLRLGLENGPQDTVEAIAEKGKIVCRIDQEH